MKTKIPDEVRAVELPGHYRFVDDERVPITVGEYVERLEAELERLRRLAILASDLDRCEHGRHEGDVCGGLSGCNGPSHGNPHMGPDRTIGYTLGARPYRVPVDRDGGDYAAWAVGR